MEFSIQKLKSLTTLITKGTTPSNIGESFTDYGIMYFRSELIGKSKYIDKSSGLLFISEETHSKLKRSQIHEGDMLFSMAGVYLGKVSLVRKKDVPANTNQAVAIIRFIPNSCNIDYVYYYMKQRWYNEYINSFSAQAAQPNINLEQIGKLKINLPNLTLQNKISIILSVYDNLISTNTKRIELLEKIIENLYKEWFVRFRFPGHETAEFENGIPKGWKNTTVEDLSVILQRGISPDYDDEGELTVISQKCIRQSIMDIKEARQEIKTFKPELNLKDGDTVICSTGTGTLGRVGQVYGEYPKTTFDSHVTMVRAKEPIGKHFLFWSLHSMQLWFMNMGVGSTNQQELNRKTIKNAKILISESELISKFESIVEPIHQRITMLINNQDNLVKQRDLLLPRLMSGKLEV